VGIRKRLCVPNSGGHINDLKDRIKAAIATVDDDMLNRTWMELEYRLDIVRVTNGAHVECVQYSEQTLRVSFADDAQTVCLCLFKEVLFASKVLYIIYTHPV
jgi:hypothetical protein